jgi:hypothetical protein
VTAGLPSVGLAFGSAAGVDVDEVGHVVQEEQTTELVLPLSPHPTRPIVAKKAIDETNNDFFMFSSLIVTYMFMELNSPKEPNFDALLSASNFRDIIGLI